MSYITLCINRKSVFFLLILQLRQLENVKKRGWALPVLIKDIKDI